ncbi:MAG TPA: hypothetical protein VNL16_11880 [Chloroflexota bacterium]|nr:hypothetical protein [Chloroflexota bacterium]
MLNCPKCGSTKVYRSKTRSAWERWRREITAKSPFRCHRCAWRGWKPDSGPFFTREEVEAATRALAKSPVDPGTLEMGSPEPTRDRRDEPMTEPFDAGVQGSRQARRDLDVSTLDQIFTTSGSQERSVFRH